MTGAFRWGDHHADLQVGAVKAAMSKSKPTTKPPKPFNPLSRRCPRCGADYGEPCRRGGGGKRGGYHIARTRPKPPRADAKPPWTPKLGRRANYPTSSGKSVRTVS